MKKKEENRENRGKQRFRRKTKISGKTERK